MTSSRPRLVRLPWGAWVNPEYVVSVVPTCADGTGVRVALEGGRFEQWAEHNADECARIINGEPDTDATRREGWQAACDALRRYGEGFKGDVALSEEEHYILAQAADVIEDEYE